MTAILKWLRLLWLRFRWGWLRNNAPDEEVKTTGEHK